MTTKQLLDEGRLAAAIEAAGAELRSRPGDRGLRTALFEMLCFAGELDRAGRQLDAIEHLDGGPTAVLGVQLYRGLLDAERRRASLFAEGVRPRFMLEPPESVSLHLEALDLVREGRPDEARARLDRAEEAESPRSGTSGEATFQGFRDADDLLAPVLEVFAPAGYCWVPWEQVQFLEVEPPKTLRDLLWCPARIASFDGQLGEVYLPTLYPGSSAHADESVRLGRRTDWADSGGIVRGLGLKTLLVGDDARTLLELRDVRFDPPAGHD
jgi:type VI secretion system protein ImpE